MARKVSIALCSLTRRSPAQCLSTLVSNAPEEGAVGCLEAVLPIPWPTAPQREAPCNSCSVVASAPNPECLSVCPPDGGEDHARAVGHDEEQGCPQPGKDQPTGAAHRAVHQHQAADQVDKEEDDADDEEDEHGSRQSHHLGVFLVRQGGRVLE